MIGSADTGGFKMVVKKASNYALLSPFKNDLTRQASVPPCFQNKDGFMQSNPQKPKSCGVPPVLSLALLIFLLQSK